jgi:hypothetical protein
MLQKYKMNNNIIVNRNIVESIVKRHECPCGSIIQKSSLKRHLKSKKHLKFEFENNEEKREEKKDERIECPCGSRIKNLAGHLKTKKHREFEKNTQKTHECEICITDQTDFHTCSRCKKKHCMDCHKRLVNPTCPFCRYRFELSRKSQIERQIEMNERHLFEIQILRRVLLMANGN